MIAASIKNGVVTTNKLTNEAGDVFFFFFFFF